MAEAALLRAERDIQDFVSGARTHHPEEIIARTLREISSKARASPVGTRLGELVEAAAHGVDGRREAAIFLIRCAAVPGLIADPTGTQNSHVHRATVELVEAGAPDLYTAAGAGAFKFTPDKYRLISALHDHLIAPLASLDSLPSSPKEFAARRQEVFRLLNQQRLKAYLGPYGFAEMVNAVREAFNNICELLETKDATFGQQLQAAFDALAPSLTRARESVDFVSARYVLPILEVAWRVLEAIDRESSERFECKLHFRRQSGLPVERRYPLHEANRIIRIKIPLVNDGPGQALDVRAQTICSDPRVLVSGDDIDLGVVAPGEFSLTFDMMVGEPVPRTGLMVELSWRNARGPERVVDSFETVIEGQDPHTDWEGLAAADPYSTEVAQGDEFVGRSRKLQALVGRLQRIRMQSSYITGQKRVGKTSLAIAVGDRIAAQDTAESETTVIYLEYGDYARSDASATVEALGAAIAARLQIHLPEEQRSNALDFRGTLAPLSQIAYLLGESCPKRRFIIILDEFDEIHPEIYRFGPLAEAFFSNLRTLSAKKNIAVVLVGGENMPFIISAQGDQLNKFVREPLDYFSRSEEWDDFVALVRQRDTLPLNWHGAAITRIFNLTNGHPYYAKLLCARVLSNAIEDRDIEVTVDEVDRAAAALIETLDTNVFAHFWKDGIPAGRDEAAVVELKRSRVLVAIGRSMRHCSRATLETIAEHRAGTGLVTTDIAPILVDFCRREILRERGKEYEFVLPLFASWLEAKGISALVADTLGDEIADSIQVAEDKAYVTSSELAQLAEDWQLYRGKAITAEDVRSWLGQRSRFTEQRLLFKMLQRVRFVSELEIREKLRTAFSVVKRHTTAYTPESRSQRRYDIVVTYVDGPAKSGSRYADLFTEENLLSSSSVISPDIFATAVVEYERGRNITVNGVVIVDDICVTGDSLSRNITEFVNRNRQFLIDRSITVVAIALLATREADERIRKSLRRFHGVDIDFRTCEVLADRHFAFDGEARLWETEDEERQAKELALDIGKKIVPKAPLGYGDRGMLLTFSSTCPNNSLPLLHGEAKEWRPLFPRPIN